MIERMEFYRQDLVGHIGRAVPEDGSARALNVSPLDSDLLEDAARLRHIAVFGGHTDAQPS
jgi:hypothetical protein